MVDADDYAAYAKPDLESDGEVSTVTRLANDLHEADAEIEAIQKQLDNAKDVARDLRERQLPEAMERIGALKLPLSIGYEVEIEEKIRTSVPKDNAPQTYSWMRENGHGHLIKREVKSDFGKGEDNVAADLAQELRERGYNVGDKQFVHPSTLASFVKECLQEGIELPDDLFSIHRQKVAKLTPIKTRK